MYINVIPLVWVGNIAVDCRQGHRLAMEGTGVRMRKGYIMLVGRVSVMKFGSENDVLVLGILGSYMIVLRLCGIGNIAVYCCLGHRLPMEVNRVRMRND